MQFGQCGRLVFEAQVLLGGLQVRIARATKPDVRLGIGLFSGQLRNGLARALGGHIDFNALALFKCDSDHAAPSGLGGTDDVDFTVLCLHLGTAHQNGQQGD